MQLTVLRGNVRGGTERLFDRGVDAREQAPHEAGDNERLARTWVQSPRRRHPSAAGIGAGAPDVPTLDSHCHGLCAALCRKRAPSVHQMPVDRPLTERKHLRDYLDAMTPR